MSDSRFPTGSNGTDPLRDRLDALRGDVDRLPARPARLVRRRGNRRTAIQIGGTSVVAASAIGLGAFVLPIGGAGEVGPQTTTSTSTPAVVPTLTEDVLLDADDVRAIDLVHDPTTPHDWTIEATHGDVGLALSPICLPRVAGPEATQALARELVPATPGADQDGVQVIRAVEVVVVQPDEATAQVTYDSLRSRVLGCGQADDTRVSAAWELAGAGDVGSITEVLGMESATEPGRVHQLALSRSGTVVTGILLTTTAPESMTPDMTVDVLHAALTRLCGEVPAACPAEEITASSVAVPVEGTPASEPEAGGDLLLTLADMPTWEGALPWDSTFDVPADDLTSGRYGVVCHPLWRDLGAVSEVERVYTDSTADPGDGASATEVVATFPDEASAEAASAEMRDGMANCEGRPDVAADLTVEMIDPLEFGDSAWVVTIPASGSDPAGRIMVGFVRSGSTTALLTVDYRLEPALSGGPFLLTLDLAASRLAQ